MSKPSVLNLAYELDWVFMYVDPNPLFMQSAEAIRDLLLENERLRVEKGFIPPERSFDEPTKWID